MTEQPEVEANYDNVSLLLAGIVAFLEDNANSNISVDYFSKDYSSKQIAVVFDNKSNEFIFELKDVAQDGS